MHAEGDLLLQISSPPHHHPASFPGVALCRLMGFWPLSVGRAKESGRGWSDVPCPLFPPSFDMRERGPSPEGEA